MCLFLCVSSPGQDDWNGTQRTVPGKAPPPSRGAKTPYREHPYRQYWSGLTTLNVSPWLPPVYHGSSCFKQPDKSNCPFCLWFGLFLHWTLYERANWELKIGTGFWDLTANSLPHPYFVTPTNHLTNRPPIPPTKAAFRWVREEKLASSFSFKFFLYFAVFFSSDPFYPPLAFLHCWSLIF